MCGSANRILFLMLGGPPRSTRADTLFPYTTLFRSGTVAARGYALRRALLDHPGERRSHVVPTPRGGGIGIVLAMLVAMGLLAYADRGQTLAMVLSAAGLLLVAGIGWLADHRPLSPWSRSEERRVGKECVRTGRSRW